MGALRAVAVDSFREWKPAPASAEASIDWPSVLDRVCRAPDLMHSVFQPIYDLRRGTVRGYELLTRFPIEVPAPPDVWFAAAARLGRAGELEATVIRAAMEARRRLGGDRFLSVNLTPHAVAEPEVQAVLLHQRRLDNLVLEITEQVAVMDYAALDAALAPVRAAGASLAVDDVGAGYSSLHQVMMLRPEFVKVDRTLVQRLDGDEKRRAIVDVMGRLATELNASVVAEGVERLAELDALMGLHVPFAQGFALGRPAENMPGADERVETYVRSRQAQVEDPDSIARLIELPPVLARDASRDEMARVFLSQPAVQHVPLVDGRGAPAALMPREQFVRGEAPRWASLRVPVTTGVAEAARRVISRTPDERFDPVICCDSRGRYAGLVRVERLLHALAG